MTESGECDALRSSLSPAWAKSVLGLLLIAVFFRSAAGAEASLVWDGIVAAPGFSEVIVRGDDLAGAATVVASTPGSPRTEYRTEARVQQGSTVSLPVAFSAPGQVTVQIGYEGRAPLELRAGELRNAPALVVAVGELAVTGLSYRPDVQAGTAANLPRLANSYTHIDAIALGARVFGRLDDAQLRALLDHIGNCGRTLLVGVPQNTWRVSLQSAGCGGRFVHFAASASDADTVLDALLRETAAPLPPQDALRGLLVRSGADLRLMALFLGSTLLVFLLLTAMTRTRRAAPAFCLLAAALSVLLWNGSGRHQFVAWAEASANDRVARYSALDVTTATGRRVLALQTGLARMPASVDGQVTLRWSAVPDERQLLWSASLLQEIRIASAGSFPVESRLRAAVDENRIVVCNNGSGASPPAYLHWQGESWRLPALEPGRHWSSTGARPVADAAPHLRLLEQRAPRAAPALLQPLAVPGNRGGAWLMRSEPEAAGVSPCRV